MHVNVVAGGGGGGGGPVTAVSGAFVDGAVVSIGTGGDAAYTGSGSSTVIAVLKGLYAQFAAQLGFGQTTMAASLPVAIANNQSAVPVSAASLPLPTGAATAANQATEITSLASLVANTPAKPTTGTASSVVNAVSNTVLLALNASRKGATVFNDDTVTTGATLKVALGFTASATAYTYAIPAQGYYEVPFGFTGVINGIASAATGNARIAELT